MTVFFQNIYGLSSNMPATPLKGLLQFQENANLFDLLVTIKLGPDVL